MAEGWNGMGFGSGGGRGQGQMMEPGQGMSSARGQQQQRQLQLQQQRSGSPSSSSLSSSMEFLSLGPRVGPSSGSMLSSQEAMTSPHVPLAMPQPSPFPSTGSFPGTSWSRFPMTGPTITTSTYDPLGGSDQPSSQQLQQQPQTRAGSSWSPSPARGGILPSPPTHAAFPFPPHSPSPPPPLSHSSPSPRYPFPPNLGFPNPYPPQSYPPPPTSQPFGYGPSHQPSLLPTPGAPPGFGYGPYPPSASYHQQPPVAPPAPPASELPLPSTSATSSSSSRRTTPREQQLRHHKFDALPKDHPKSNSSPLPLPDTAHPSSILNTHYVGRIGSDPALGGRSYSPSNENIHFPLEEDLPPLENHRPQPPAPYRLSNYGLGGGDSSSSQDEPEEFYHSQSLPDSAYHRPQVGSPLSGHSSSYSSSGHHPYEPPSRNLFIRNISNNIDDDILRFLFEPFAKNGGLRKIQTHTKTRGFVIVSFYDLRDAMQAMASLNGRVLHKKPLYIHYAVPPTPKASDLKNTMPEYLNQGTLVVFNVDLDVTGEELRKMFSAYGDVKEIRDAPSKPHHRFVEFYDVRCATAAMVALKGTMIRNKYINIEYALPGVRTRTLSDDGEGIPKEHPYKPSSSWSATTSSDSSSSSFGSYSSSKGISPFEYGMSIVSPPVSDVPINLTSSTGSLTSSTSSLSTTNDAPTEEIGVIGGGNTGSERERHGGQKKLEDVQNQIHLHNIHSGTDKRSSIMIRNIPNKYSQSELIALINERYKGKYDFIYLPIDFNNKCNFGYAFMNFVNYQDIPSFYQEFHHKKWPQYYSSKVAEICYARIQGKKDLVRNFQNSFILDAKCAHQPLIFYSDGPNKGLPEPWPTAPLPGNRTKPTPPSSFFHTPHLSPSSKGGSGSGSED